MLGCLAGQRWVHVCVDGSVKPCPYLPFEYGNIENESLKSIWKKIRSYPQFKGERHVCLMHDPKFMELVSKIPKDAKVPYDFDLLKQ